MNTEDVKTMNTGTTGKEDEKKTLSEQFDDFCYRCSHKWYWYCKKHKWADWIDDNILWYIWKKPKDKYYSIRAWFRCNWNKEHYRLIKDAFASKGWDHYHITMIEERQIDKMLKWFENHQLMVDEQYHELLRTLRWAKHCIHIINDNSDLFHYEGEIRHIPVKRVIDENGNASFVKLDNDSENVHLYELDMSESKYVYDGPYVNTRNAKRFLNKFDMKLIENGTHIDELYVRKCKHLYYLIRYRYTDIWWD